MSENDSESSQHFTSHSTNLGLMGSVGPRLLPCSWDLLCSALLCLLSSHSQNIGYPAYSAVILFFISASSFFIFTFPTFLSPPPPPLPYLSPLFLPFTLFIGLHQLFYVFYVKLNNLLCSVLYRTLSDILFECPQLNEKRVIVACALLSTNNATMQMHHILNDALNFTVILL